MQIEKNADQKQCRSNKLQIERILSTSQGGNCHLGRPQYRGDGIGHTVENATVFSIESSMTKMKDDQGFRYKEGVAAHNWIAHLVDSHKDAIQKQVN